ncbi:MAG: heparinase II/III family protein [Candidatus Omnitrophota bacterium]
MRRWLIRLGMAFFFAAYSTVLLPAMEKGDILKTLKKSHPRLILTDERVAEIKQLIAKDKTAGKIYRDLQAEADRIMKAAPVEYKLEGPRLLSQSRRCLDRLYTLCLLYRLDKKKEYIDRARAEIYAAANFPDWHPPHFLDTAEMTHALAIAYDWFYNDLSPAERKVIRTALIEKGFEPYLRACRENTWWSVCSHNWNQVCNGGVGVAALAVADEEPEIASDILNFALENIKIALKEYAPDGGWNEGPGYWHYATRYTVYFLASLQTALGTDFGLSAMEGMDRTGFFRMDFTGPTNLTFNYADASPYAGGAAEMFWMADRYDKPVYAWHQLQRLNHPEALDLVWYTAKGEDPSQSGLPIDAFYRGVDVAFFRSAWNDPNALFVGFKGGDNKANHSHLDLGGFVLDADGIRWAVDLGGDDYNLPGYFGSKRWTYFRLNTHSHNTIMIDGQNQDPKAAAPIVRFDSKPDWAFAVADLSAAYASQAKKVVRGIAMADRKRILIQDEINALNPSVIEWSMLTPGEIQVDGSTAILKKSGKTLQAEILSPAGAAFHIESANPPAPEKQQPDIKKLVVRPAGKTENCRFAILLTPCSDGAQPPKFSKPIVPLDEWR